MFSNALKKFNIELHFLEKARKSNCLNYNISFKVWRNSRIHSDALMQRDTGFSTCIWMEMHKTATYWA